MGGFVEMPGENTSATDLRNLLANALCERDGRAEEAQRWKARNERLVALLCRALPAMEGDEAWLEDNWPNLEAAWTALTADIRAALHEEGR